MASFPHPLQSPEWSTFRKQWGNEILETPYGFLTLHKLPLLPYKIGMFIKGPEPNQQMLSDLKVLGKKRRIIFIKMEPNCGWELPITNSQLSLKLKLEKLLKRNGATNGKTLFTPTTFWIDLTPSEEELLRSFSSKTRYNIKVAQKHGVEVKEDNSPKAFEKYLDLTRETIQRQGFYAHTEKYHHLMWAILHKAGIAHLLTAVYNKQIITTWILFAYKGFLYYPYGASTDKHKEVMANNLMMWEAIKFGKKLGLKTFDLWGREEGKGFTRFKEGYNPKVIEFLGTWDLVLSPLYWPYRLAEKIRWIILRLQGKMGLSKISF